MSKAKKANNQKYIILAIALTLAALGYYGYRSMLVKPDINKIDVGGNSNGDKTKPTKSTYRMERIQQPANKK